MELLLSILFALAIVACATICILRAKKSALPKEADQLAADYEKRVEQESRAWMAKIGKAKHLLVSKSWHDPDGKEEFVRLVYGRVPQYLFYALGNLTPNRLEKSFLLGLFWPDFDPGFGDFVLQQSRIPEIGIMLRIRSPQIFVPEVTINGQTCPLYQIGLPCNGEIEPGCVDFIKLTQEKVTA